MASVRQQTGTWLQVHTQSGVQLGFRQPCAWPPDNFLGGRCDVCARSSHHLASWQEWSRLESNRDWPVDRENGTLTASLSTEFLFFAAESLPNRHTLLLKLGRIWDCVEADYTSIMNPQIKDPNGEKRLFGILIHLNVFIWGMTVFWR